MRPRLDSTVSQLDHCEQVAGQRPNVVGQLVGLLTMPRAERLSARDPGPDIRHRMVLLERPAHCERPARLLVLCHVRLLSRGKPTKQAAAVLALPYRATRAAPRLA